MRNKPLWPFTLNQASPQANGLVGWWPGGHGGYRLLDMSGRGNHGTLTNFAAPMSATSGWAAGNGGGKGAIAFDNSDDYINITNAGLNKSTDFTWSVWYYPVTNGGTSGPGLFFYTTTGSNFLFVGQASGGTTDLSFGRAGQAHDVVASNVVVNNVWQHLAVTKAGAGGAITLYRNGRVVQTGTSASGGTNTGTFQIGTTSFKINGLIEEPRIYNRALSAAEVAALYSPATRWQLRSQRKFVFQGADLTSHVETFTTPGSGTWTPPASVTSYVVECIGGGGAGGYSYDAGGGGGGGGGYARSTRNCTAGVGINYHVGAGEIANVSASEPTWFVNDTTVLAGEGAVGGNGITVGGFGGGGAGYNIGDVTYSGGTGGAGGSVGGGGGASSAGSASTGNNGDNGTPSLGGAGGAAVTDGGYGGNGGDSGNAGSSGANPGGGGGGDAVGGGSGYGTNGGNGWIRVSYIAVTVTATQSLISRCMSIPMSICTR